MAKKWKTLEGSNSKTLEKPIVQCQSNPSEISVGQKVTLECTLPAANPQGKIVFQNFGKEEPHSIKFLGEPELLDSTVKQSFTSYRVGQHNFNSITLDVGDKAFLVSPVSVNVKTVIQAQMGAQPTPYPNVAPREAPVPWWWWGLWIALAVAILGIAAWQVYKFIQARKMRQEMAENQRPLTVQEKFQKNLRKLESKGHHLQGHYKKFALELTSILKIAIGEQLGFSAEDMTTEEMIETLAKKHRGFNNKAGAQVASILGSLDEIKFAKTQTTSEQCIDLLDQVSKVGRLLFGASS